MANVGVIIAWLIVLSLAPLKSLSHSVAAGEFSGEGSLLQVRMQIPSVSWLHLVSSASSSGNDTRAKVVERSLMA